MSEHVTYICDKCSGKQIRSCKRCGEQFCPEYASKIDMQFCQYCLKDVYFEDTIVEKVVITKSASGKKTFKRTMKARRIVFTGQDWMFAQARVTTLSAEELEATIEYHREILSGMMNEREVRRIKNNQKNLAKMIAHTTSRPKAEDNVELAEGEISKTVITKTTKTVVKKTGPDPAAAIKALVDLFKAKGMNEAQIKGALLAMATPKTI